MYIPLRYGFDDVGKPAEDSDQPVVYTCKTIQYQFSPVKYIKFNKVKQMTFAFKSIILIL